MPPPNIQGLNLVHTHPHSVPAHDTDIQDLISSPHFQELEAQLDLWTNLAFQSDEPLVQSHSHPPSPATPFDLNSFISGFNQNGYPPVPLDPPPTNPPQHINTASLAQILALQGVTPASFAALHSAAAAGSDGTDPQKKTPPAKRHRTRKSSISTVDNDSEPPSPANGLVSNIITGAGNSNGTGTPLTAAEDKRRRNTAASARFRLKKKEREAALESKAKELEVKVVELERECEALRRENGWLKGLVVGVTGAAQQPNASAAAVNANKTVVNAAAALITTAKDETQGGQ
jgi:hypothetical protein